jgi:hypothetical protein
MLMVFEVQLGIVVPLYFSWRPPLRGLDASRNGRAHRRGCKKAKPVFFGGTALAGEPKKILRLCRALPGMQHFEALWRASNQKETEPMETVSKIDGSGRENRLFQGMNCKI